ncbi:hypothetical protein J2S10_004014 [Neobacillus ginsengisoli]|uniref:Uncharacterized protein n=1 Tax=Neobacillus ginsengisoli TaxID=904295 RepID=A0ABT9XZ12_9BACI|nr:hypothetical protein [Neobacillus ginsengisoli]
MTRWEMGGNLQGWRGACTTYGKYAHFEMGCKIFYLMNLKPYKKYNINMFIFKLKRRMV